MELQPLKHNLIGGLQRVRAWFKKMIDPQTNRFFYKYDPRTRQFSKDPSPVRDLGTAADLGTLQSYFQTQEFSQAIEQTLDHFRGALVRERTFEQEGILTAGGLGHTETEAELSDQPMPWSYLDPERIREPSSIAHNAMFILALAAHEHYPREAEKELLMAELADGIVHLQRSDGTYKVYFSPSDLGDFGYELYSGEAMLALLTAYERLGDERYLASVQRAMPQYERIYRSGSIDRAEIVFFANWQSQAGRMLVRHSAPQQAAHISSYLYTLQDSIIGKVKLYEALREFPEEMATVEVACALEGLVDVLALAMQEEGHAGAARRGRYIDAVRAAVTFLQDVQEHSAQSGGATALGGLGHGLTMPLQRIDVTGHAACAYIKLLRLLEEREP